MYSLQSPQCMTPWDLLHLLFFWGNSYSNKCIGKSLAGMKNFQKVWDPSGILGSEIYPRWLRWITAYVLYAWDLLVFKDLSFIILSIQASLVTLHVFTCEWSTRQVKFTAAWSCGRQEFHPHITTIACLELSAAIVAVYISDMLWMNWKVRSIQILLNRFYGSSWVRKQWCWKSQDRDGIYGSLKY